MEFTGFYYSFYFDKNTDIIIKELKKTNFCCEESEFNGEKSYFFYKDDEMYKNHLENGYSLDKNGEGCFCLETKRIPINGEAFWRGYPDIPAYFSIKEVNYIFLILPAEIDDSVFSKGICERIFRAIEI